MIPLSTGLCGLSSVPITLSDTGELGHDRRVGDDDSYLAVSVRLHFTSWRGPSYQAMRPTSQGVPAMSEAVRVLVSYAIPDRAFAEKLVATFQPVGVEVCWKGSAYSNEARKPLH